MRTLQILLISVILAVIPSMTTACKITVAVDGNQKEKYKTGEVVVVIITVVLEHRNCDVDLNQTDIRVSGSQITGATSWVTTKDRTWQKKIKIKIAGDGKATITAERSCERDGGKGSLTLLVEG